MAMAQCLSVWNLPSTFVSSTPPSIIPFLHLKTQVFRFRPQDRIKPTGFRCRPRQVGRRELQLCKAGDASISGPSSLPEDPSSVPPQEQSPQSFFSQWQMKSADLRAKAAKWGLAAVLAYGLFDGITYTTFFVLAFLSYEKSTGQNPAANLKALLGVVVLMWGGNNVTRPFRVAGAAALAPAIDKGLKKLQDVLKLPNQAFAFMICVAVFASMCFSVVGVLILSRLRR